MEKHEVSQQDLELLAAALAKAIPDIDCPECCECGCVYQYVEQSSQVYREEWEWACFYGVLVQYRLARKSAS